MGEGRHSRVGKESGKDVISGKIQSINCITLCPYLRLKSPLLYLDVRLWALGAGQGTVISQAMWLLFSQRQVSRDRDGPAGSSQQPIFLAADGWAHGLGRGEDGAPATSPAPGILHL